VQTLASRATEFADLDDPGYLAERLQGFRAAGAGEAVRIALARDPAETTPSVTIAWMSTGADGLARNCRGRSPGGREGRL
jgi:hypothetical protein